MPALGAHWQAGPRQASSGGRFLYLQQLLLLPLQGKEGAKYLLWWYLEDQIKVVGVV